MNQRNTTFVVICLAAISASTQSNAASEKNDYQFSVYNDSSPSAGLHITPWNNESKAFQTGMDRDRDIAERRRDELLMERDELGRSFSSLDMDSDQRDWKTRESSALGNAIGSAEGRLSQVEKSRADGKYMTHRQVLDMLIQAGGELDEVSEKKFNQWKQAQKSRMYQLAKAKDGDTYLAEVKNFNMALRLNGEKEFDPGIRSLNKALTQAQYRNDASAAQRALGILDWRDKRGWPNPKSFKDLSSGKDVALDQEYLGHLKSYASSTSKPQSKSNQFPDPNNFKRPFTSSASQHDSSVCDESGVCTSSGTGWARTGSRSRFRRR